MSLSYEERAFFRKFYKLLLFLSVVCGWGGVVMTGVGMLLVAAHFNPEFGVDLWVGVFVLALGVVGLFLHYFVEEAKREHEHRL